MTLQMVQEVLNARLLTEGSDLSEEVFSACGSDLMSDVLAFVKDQALLLTGLVNPQVIRTAEMMDIKAIVFVRGKVPTSEIISLAIQKEMVLFTTELPLYVASGKLYCAGLQGKEQAIV